MSELLLPGPAWLVALCLGASVRGFVRRESRLGRLRWLFVGLTLWSWGFSTPGIANALTAQLEARHPEVALPPADPAALIVVLSSGSTVRRDGRDEVDLDRAAWQRTFAALRLWRATGGQLLFAGGPTPDGQSSQAERMAQIARASGVPESAILVEPRSLDTHENLASSRALIAEHGEHAWLVTSAMHLPRALAVAHRLGLSPHPFACDRRAVTLRHFYAWLPNLGAPESFRAPLHELIGLLYYRLRGWA